MSFKDKIIAAISAVPEEEAVTQVNPTATETVPVVTPVATVPVIDPAAQDEVSRLRADNARLLRRGFEAEGTNFANTALHEGRAFPSEKEALTAFFVQACVDDSVLGAIAGGQTRVSMLQALVASRPAHQLTAESLTPALAQIIRNGTVDPVTDPTAKEVSDEDVKALLGKTAFGAQVLKELQGVKS